MDSTRLIFSPYTRRLLAERHEGWDETGVPAVPAKYKKTRQLAVSLFPSFSRDVLDNALTSSGLVIPDKGIILPNRNNISFLDFESKSVQALINLPENSAWEFSGGLSFKSSIIVLLWHEPKTYLFLYRDGKIKGLAAIDSTGFSQVEVKHKSNDRVVFLVRAHATYDKGDNPLFIFDGEQLFRVKEHAQLYDAAVDSMGQKIAYCYWEADKRHIVVKEFDPYGKSSSVR